MISLRLVGPRKACDAASLTPPYASVSTMSAGVSWLPSWRTSHDPTMSKATISGDRSKKLRRSGAGSFTFHTADHLTQETQWSRQPRYRQRPSHRGHAVDEREGYGVTPAGAAKVSDWKDSLCAGLGRLLK